MVHAAFSLLGRLPPAPRSAASSELLEGAPTHAGLASSLVPGSSWFLAQGHGQAEGQAGAGGGRCDHTAGTCLSHGCTAVRSEAILTAAVSGWRGNDSRCKIN